MRETIQHYVDQYRYFLQLLADEYDREEDEGKKLILMTRSNVYSKTLSDMELLLKLCDVYDL